MEWLRRAAWPADRRGWGAAATLIVFVAHAVRHLTWMAPKAGITYSDGYYSWLFARSLAFDYDIDFTNDYAICGDPFQLGVDEGGGRPTNPFYFGPAMILAPVLWVVRHIVRLAPTASASWRSGCTGPFVFYTGTCSILVTTLTVLIAYRVARRWYAEGPSAIALLVMGLASPLNIMGTLSWYYSHVWGALAVAIVLLCAVRASERPESPWRWLAAGLSAGFASLMRMPEGLWVFVAIAAIGSLAVSAHARGERRVVVTAITRAALVSVGFAAMFSLQLLVFQRLYGSPFVIPQGKLYVQLSHAHPWLLLFGARSGLLYWTPLLWLSIFGIPWFVRRDPAKRAMAIAVVVVGCATFYIASSALSWTGSASLGARIQTSLVPALLPPAAAFLEALVRWAERRRLGAHAAVALLLAPWLVIGWNAAASGVPNDRPVPAPQLYGSGMTYTVKQIYDSIGNPWTLPASAVFYARYRAAPSVLDGLASDGMFQKHYRTLALAGSDTLAFASPPSTYWSEGLQPAAAGAPGTRLEGSARFLVTLYWPWVTKVRLTAKAVSGPVTVKIRSGSFFGRRTVGEVTLTGSETVEIAVPARAFDSGINEVLLSSDGPLDLVSWTWVDDGPHDTSTHLLKRK
ncbi:MAG: hypothetical protein JWP97_5947 [Labilithrix sp.]|nr:hypothetical protein [Labilithrix sp.]